VPGELGEPDPGIHDDRRWIDSRRGDGIDALPELVTDLSHHVVVDGPLLHVVAGPARVHDGIGHACLGHQPRQPRVGLAAADVVDHPCPRSERELGHGRPRGVHADGKARPGQLVVLESSTYPGTTEEVVKPILESVSGLRAGEDFFLAFSPEREDPGNTSFNTANIPKVVGGFTPRCTEVASALYAAAITRVVQVRGTREAELTKLLENIFRCVNIALVNELKLLCERMGIDVFEVISAAATKPFGFMPFYPGPGLGGHCIPIDPFYLTWKAREFEFQTRFIELAGEINTSMPYHVVQRTMDALNSVGQTLKGTRILVLGLAYKKNVDDLRESPSIRIIELLRERGAQVEYHDPWCPRITEMRHKPAYLLEMESVDLQQGLARADAVIIVTDHDAVDYADVVRDSRLVIDTRNATRNVVSGREKIWTA